MKPSLSRRTRAVQMMVVIITLAVAVPSANTVLARSARAAAASTADALSVAMVGLMEGHPSAIVHEELPGIFLRMANDVPAVVRVALVNPNGEVFDSESRGMELRHEPAVLSVLSGGREPLAIVTTDRRVLRKVSPVLGAYDPGVRAATRAALVVDVDLDQSERRLFALQTRTGLALAAMIALLFGAQFVVLERSLFGRLGRLRRAVTAFGKGDRGVRVAVGPLDEIGEVASEFNRMADHVGHSIDAIAAAEQMKTDFVSFASHQFRTPLAGLNWMLELAETVPGQPAQAREHLREARTSTDRLVRLVNDLLNVSRLEWGRIDDRVEAVDLADLTRRVVDSFAPQAAQKPLDLRFDRASSVCRVAADASLLREALANLVSNAVKYTPPGGRIRVGVQEAGSLVRWHVADTGIGIPAAQRDRLFEKFFRADNAIEAGVEGNGMGLSFARLVVKRFGGTLSVESEEGRGTRFELTLPAVDAAAPAASESDRKGKA